MLRALQGSLATTQTAREHLSMVPNADCINEVTRLLHVFIETVGDSGMAGRQARASVKQRLMDSRIREQLSCEQVVDLGDGPVSLWKA